MSSVRIDGAEHFDEESIKACLATHERERFGFVLGGAPTPQCGVPPFDATRMPVNLWAWPWTDWPLFNQTAFERDQDRIERWYQARGYYGAQITDADVAPHGEAVSIRFEVSEGEPSLIVRIGIDGVEKLPPDVRTAVYDAMELEIGEPFDEVLYENTKRAMVDALQDASFARAAVLGNAQVDPDKKLVRVAFHVVPGPPCTFGSVAVEGNGDLPKTPIRAAAAIEPGDPFSLSAMRDARFAIFGLGPFASVEIDRILRADKPVVDVVIRVQPARTFRFGVGIGMTSGGLYPEDYDPTNDAGFAQWDVHLLGKIEHRNFLGGMRTLRIEDRPRLIFNNDFPDASDSDPGNWLGIELRQPAFIDARTTLVARARWDRGPDPYGGRFLRDDLVVGLGPERRFFEGHLRLAATINLDLFLPDRQQPYPTNHVTYLYYVAQLDLRDDPRNTRRGAYFALGVQQAGYFLPSDWDYVRITGDSRGYIPLGLGLTLAGRARIGFMFITETSISAPADPIDDNGRFLQDLALRGPLRHRLRGGGPNSVRGYVANTLGDVEVLQDRLLSGGLRQWEASVELRLQVTESLGAVAFVDMGDVTRQEHFRFNYWQPSFGLGLRYRTIVGPVRFDAAFAPKSIQVIGTDNRVRDGVDESNPLGIEYGAFTLTIGEAF